MVQLSAADAKKIKDKLIEIYERDKEVLTLKERRELLRLIGTVAVATHR